MLIEINAICPGAVDTDMVEEPLRTRLRDEGSLLRPEEVAAGALLAANSGETGLAWIFPAGRAPEPFRFPGS